MAKKKNAAERFIADNRPQFSSENTGTKQYKRKPSPPRSSGRPAARVAGAPKRRHTPAPGVRVKKTIYRSHVKSSYVSALVRNAVKTRQSRDSVKRVYTPLESDRLQGQTRDLPHSPTHLRPRRKAKRSLILKPAPIAITAPQSELDRKRTWVFSILTKQLASLDYLLICIVLALSVIGIIAVSSATRSFSTAARFNAMQIGMTSLGIILMIALSFFNYDNMLKHDKAILLLNLFLLTVTFLFGSGVTEDTNANWLSIGPVRIQPSEFSKILFIMSLAAHLERVKDRINSIKSVLGLLLHGGVVIGFVYLQKDLGMAVVFTAIFAMMCFFSKISLWYCLAGVAMAVAASPFIWNNLSTYQKKRILVGFHPESDPLGYGWQVLKSKTAIGAGGMFGTGYGRGGISQSSAFPAKQTDMIFAVIGEEAGLIGALIVLGLLFLLTLKIMHTATIARNAKGTYLCAGVAAMIIFQTAENIGMCLGFMPVIGITLPFISYGGSSVLSLYLAMGMVLSVYSNKDTYFSKRV